jgi:hypothetical protein
MFKILIIYKKIIKSCKKTLDCLVGECAMLRDSEEKLKQQLSDLALRERVLVRRLAAKEQDMQEYAVSIYFLLVYIIFIIYMLMIRISL